ncbi:MAG: hypothetical protein M1282_00770 [Chloroflexi bacterium]|nr:hypothetical protein [Chloroflexota bacterium]
MQRKPPLYPFLIIVLLIGLSCKMPALISAPASAVPPAPNENGTSAPVAESSTPTPTIAPTIVHAMTPADVSLAGTVDYDVDSSGTGPEHRAPYGDSYNINLFERPFTQTDMTYLPELDIVTFRLTEDANWYYVFMELTGGDMNNQVGINYGVEIDTNHDGFGDVLIWAHPIYTTTWSADIVRVYTDTNHDTGGISAEKSDAPYAGNGYDTLIFDQGQGSDPDLAWARLDPKTASTVEFAFKRSLAGNAFMWGGWADAGLRDPAKFNYNDRFTEAEAGSPEKSEQYYPIKAIYAVDNTCWAAVGFKPTGYEPHLCPPLAPQPTKQPKPAPTPFIPFFPINPCIINPSLCAPVIK